MDIGGAIQGIGKGTTEWITGGPPDKTYIGGSEQAYNDRSGALGGVGEDWSAGGMTNANQGVGYLNSAAGQIPGNYQDASSAYQTGLGIGQQGYALQGAGIKNARSAASGMLDTEEMQRRMAMDQLRRGMTNQAARARGGNQAAAMRNAQAETSMMGVQANQQIAMQQMQERNARSQRLAAIEMQAAGLGSQQANQGYGMSLNGLAAKQGATAQLAGVGNQLAGIGTGQANVGLGGYGLQNQFDLAQFDANRANSSAAYASGSPLAAWGGVAGGISSVWGGGQGNYANQLDAGGGGGGGGVTIGGGGGATSNSIGGYTYNEKVK